MLRQPTAPKCSLERTAAFTEKRAHTVHHIVDMMKTFNRSSTSLDDHHGELYRLGSETAHLARRFGNDTVGLARRIGPRRGMMGLIGLAVMIGGGMALARYLKARKAARLATTTTVTAGEPARGTTISSTRPRAPNATEVTGSH
jgi:hypothetical protein